MSQPIERDPRVYFAAERTMLAWVRTGIAMMGFGFILARFGLFLRELSAAQGMAPTTVPHANPLHTPGLSVWLGSALVLIGVGVNFVAAVAHLRFRSRFERGEPFVTPRALRTIALVVLLTALGFAMTAYLVLLGRP